MDNLNSLNAISPVDGRYRKQTEGLSDYFSEAAYMKFRLKVEVEYFIHLADVLPQLNKIDRDSLESLRNIYRDFSPSDAGKVKEIETKTNHDVKAVEYFMKEKLSEINLGEFGEFVHIGLTSQDINNTAIPLMVASALHKIIYPEFGALVAQLRKLSEQWSEIPMLARTHGQPASPTRLGKEIFVFIERLENQLAMLKEVPVNAKFGGATGNFNAHVVAYPEVDWIQFADKFIGGLGLQRSKVTTQIEHYDNLAALFDNMRRINNIMIDLVRDSWTYISLDYFKQEVIEGETGSSTMPHKVNPIDFENAEGNLTVANALFSYLSDKLPISRLQRDLTDSTVIRNVGVPFAHTLISLKSIMRGLKKLKLNESKIFADLDANWMVVAEAIQTILRKEGYPKPYEKLKEFTRNGTVVNASTMRDFIDGLEVNTDVKARLKEITPHNYIGVFKP